VPALCRLVSKLRGGQCCFCDTPQVPACGSFDWTILISFRDGVEWVLRSPRDDDAIKSDETNLLLLASEAKLVLHHNDLLLHHSKLLVQMMNGDMSEAQKGYAVINC